MNVLEGYDIGLMGFGSMDYLYYFIEVKKFVFEDWVKFYVDFDFNEILVVGLILDEYVVEWCKLICLICVGRNYIVGNLFFEEGDMIYLIVVDEDCMMVLLI